MAVRVVVTVYLFLAACISPLEATNTFHLNCPYLCKCTQNNATLTNTDIIVAINCSSLILTRNILFLSASNPDETTAASVNNTSPYGNETTPVLPVNTLVERFDLSYNALTSVTIESYSYHQNTSKLLDDVLVQIPVSNLDYSHNRLNTLPVSGFINFINVQSLSLSHNRLVNVTNGVFKGLKSLKKIDLSHNYISEVDSLSLENLVNLQVLDLSFNQLQVLNHIHGLSSLKYLYLHHNNIVMPQSATSNTALLPNLQGLIYLDISHNPLETTATGMLKGLHQLQTLNMSSCSLMDIKEKCLIDTPRLQRLMLDNNNLTSIINPVFQNTSLQYLSIASNKNLLNLTHNTFSGLSRLRHLNLSHNQGLAFVHPNMLTTLKHLKVLDLSHCVIDQLSQTTFENTQLEQIYLGGNPLLCSCVNAWLPAEVIQNKSSRFIDIMNTTCTDPSNGTIYSFLETSFTCEEITLHNVTSRATVLLGKQLRLACPHASDEPVMIEWTTPSGQIFTLHNFHPDASDHLLSPKDVQPDAPYHKGHYWHGSNSYHSEVADIEDRVLLLTDGSLYIDYMLRTDTGTYRCKVSNAHYNQTAKVTILLQIKISGEIKIYGIVVGFLCVLGFFTLNITYIIITWIANKLVNKRRRETIRQMLENMNAYKSSQIARIHENYTHQLERVRNQYHTQRDKLHQSYSQQVKRMKRGCSNQVEWVRDSYSSRLTQLRDYSSSQVVQIRERASAQIVRIRDYGAVQLERLRETYKLQHLHVMKLLDTMNLDNCRHMVETECMRTESMMFDVDLLGDGFRTDTDSPMISGGESEYNTPDASPPHSLIEKGVNPLSNIAPGIFKEDSLPYDDITTPPGDTSNIKRFVLHPVQQQSQPSPKIIMELQTRLDMDAGLTVDLTEQWEYTDPHKSHQCANRHEHSPPHRYFTKVSIASSDGHQDQTLLNLQALPDRWENNREKQSIPLPEVHLDKDKTDENKSFVSYTTPPASPTKSLPPPKNKTSRSDTEQGGDDSETDL